MHKSIRNIDSYDFLSFPHNPEDYYTLLYMIEKNDNYEIYKAINNETREIFSIKIIPLDNKISYDKLKEESLIMKSLTNCENIIKYYGSFFSFRAKNIWLIYEYCPSGSVYDLLKIIERSLIEQEISIIINDILNALIYIHQLNIIHGNIKSTNILLKEDGKVKLGNFSKANQILDNTILLYSKGRSIKEKDPKYDIFLLGIVCVELFKGINDFDRSQFMELINNNKNKSNNSFNEIIKNNYLVGKEHLCSNDFIDFIQKCLETNSYKRPTAFELKNHAFIKNNINADNSEKTNFWNLIRFNMEKIEYYKKEKNYNQSKTILTNKTTKTNKTIKTNKTTKTNKTIKTNKTNKTNKTKKTNKTIKSNNQNFSHLYSSISSNTKKTKNSNINNNDKNNSINISNIININNETFNSRNNDKLAEFKFAQMGKNEELESEKYTNKDILVDNSNLDNTGFHYCTDDSMEKSFKQSAVFGKVKNIKNDNKTFINQKNKSLLKSIYNGEKNSFRTLLKKSNENNKANNNENNKNINNNVNNNNIINSNFSINDSDNKFIKMESEEIDYFKANWDHLNKYEGIIKTKISESNNNFDLQKQLLNLNIDDSFDINNLNINNLNLNINNNFNNNLNNKLNNNHNNDNNIIKSKFTKCLKFSEMKCTIIQLGTTIKKYITKNSDFSDNSSRNSIKLRENREFSLKNSLVKPTINNETNYKNSTNKSQKLLVSFRNNAFNDLDMNLKKSYAKDKVYKNDINSSSFTSINTPNNKNICSMEIIPEKFYTCKPFLTSTQKNIFENDSNAKKKAKRKTNYIKKRVNGLKKCESEFIFKRKDYQKPSLYKYIKELDNQNDIIIKKNKTNIIKVGIIFDKNKKKYKKLD